MEWLNWERKRMLVFLTIALAGIAHINLFGINKILSPFTDYVLVGEINVITVIGIVTVLLAYLLKIKKLG